MKTIVRIEGMMCEGCASSVQEIISNIKDVQSVDVNLEKGLAEINSNKKIPIQLLQNAMEENNKDYEVQEI